jgi:hypothetical protein
MTYRVLGRRAAQMDTHQPTQMTRQLQLGGSGGISPPNQRTLLGHSENYPTPGQGDDGYNPWYGGVQPKAKQSKYY